MLDRSERIVVEAVRRSDYIVIELPDGTRIKIGGVGPNEVGVALQFSFNRNRNYARKNCTIKF